MLKGIPSVISPELMKVLLEMGHGDELVIADGNFPSAHCAQRLVRCDGHGTLKIMEAILPFFPLDTYVKHPVALMAVVEGDPTVPAIWGAYNKMLKQYDDAFSNFEMVERFRFYERAKQAYAIVATGEQATYANIILKKGVVVED